MQERTSRLLSRGFVSVLVAQTCFGYSFSSFLLFPKFLATELGANAAQIGQVATTNRLSTMVGLLVSGMAVDRFGRRHFLTGGAILMHSPRCLFSGYTSSASRPAEFDEMMRDVAYMRMGAGSLS